MACYAIVLAGGTGSRADRAGTGLAKQYRMVGGESVVARACHPFLANPRVDGVLVVIRAGTQAGFRAALAPHPRLLEPVVGGACRQDSVRQGLEALRDFTPELVLIHDAARPFVSLDLIDRVLDALRNCSAVVPALPVSDTLKRAGTSGLVKETVSRDDLFAAQTPQGFGYQAILEAHLRAAHSNRTFTDDGALAEWNGLDVALVPGDGANWKLTTEEDFAVADALVAGEVRTGTGFDVHAFGPGDCVTLCGVTVPHDAGLTGHSDADVGLHAVADAIFGALAEGDIGSHFPPDEPKWRGARSSVFVEFACDRVRARNGRITNIDVTLVCESPKIGPHREAMRERLAQLLAIAPNRVAVKATTTEGLGFTGRREGIAAQATVSLALPVSETAQ